MRRIVFIIVIGIVMCGIIGFSSRVGAGEDSVRDESWKHPDYKEIAIELPPFAGETYEAQVPDTLDLTDRAALCINGITRLVNPEYDYAQYSYAELRHDPPYGIMEAGITNLNPKWLEGLPLMRIMSGSEQNLDIDHHIIEGVMHNVGFDGLNYQPPHHPGAFYDEFSRKQNKPAANIFGEGRQLMAWSVWSQVDPNNEAYRKISEQKIQRLLEIATRKDDTLYFRRTQGYTPGQENTDTLEVVAVTDHDVKDSSLGMVGTAVAHSVSPAAMGAARYYRVTGYKPALELATGLARYYAKYGKAIDEKGRWHGYHFHIMTTGILGQLEYALAAEDREMLDWVRRAYEYGVSIGDPVLGFFAGVPGCEGGCQYNPNADECGKDHTRTMVEPCSIADMALIALQLTRGGMGDYYEDVEHYARNLLVESQVTDLDFMKDYPEELIQSDHVKNQFKATMGDHPDPRKVSYDNIAERAVGSFACANPNQMYHFMAGVQVCGCCLGNGSRVLFYIWDSILESQGKDLRVNLLLNRASPWADLNSYLPYEGKVVLKMKQRRNVFVRIPSWTDWDQVRCSVDGKPRKFEWAGRYIRVPKVKKGQALTVEFPMKEQTLYRNLRGKDHVIDVRGFTVVDVQPHVEVTPLFQRDRYRQSEAPMRKVRRFVSNQNVEW